MLPLIPVELLPAHNLCEFMTNLTLTSVHGFILSVCFSYIPVSSLLSYFVLAPVESCAPGNPFYVPIQYRLTFFKVFICLTACCSMAALDSLSLLQKAGSDSLPEFQSPEVFFSHFSK